VKVGLEEKKDSDVYSVSGATSEESGSGCITGIGISELLIGAALSTE